MPHTDIHKQKQKAKRCCKPFYKLFAVGSTEEVGNEPETNGELEESGSVNGNSLGMTLMSLDPNASLDLNVDLDNDDNSEQELYKDSAGVIIENPVDEYEVKAQEANAPITRDFSFSLQQYHQENPSYEFDDTINKYQTWKDNLKQWEAALELCLKAYNECENKIFLLQTNAAEEYEKALEEEVKWSDLLSEYIETVTPEGAIYKAKLDAYRTAKDNYDTAVEAYHDKKSNNETTLAGYNADLANLWQQITKAKEKLTDLLGGEEAQITAKVSGTIQTLNATPGDTKKKDDVLATIEVPDMGYMMSFSVTNDQASRLRVGDTGTVSNFYWGDEITATLKSIQIDQKNPATNKLLTFDLSGNVTAGSELTVSVGQKSANYDVIIPSSSVRTDANGTYVLKMESKNSPLGNRYLARRVPVEVLAVDDTNSAVSADLGYGDYVITSSSAPLKNGQMVRLATSS